ncbi:MAG TPA: c-type cytochrome, partial [Candidatus Binatia bacterium]|nr:c-type cytochrome [Candidatus Binatia bacterium]
MRRARWLFGTALAFLVVPVAAWPGTAPTSTEALTLGKEVFSKQCAACHGAEGRGDGEAAYLLYPRPRNFRAGRFRLVSTWEGVPTDDDLFQTISRGMPGSAMPSWAHLPEGTRWALVAYVKSLVETPLEVKPAAPPPSAGKPGTGVIALPPEPAYDERAQARAATLFRDNCASC